MALVYKLCNTASNKAKAYTTPVHERGPSLHDPTSAAAPDRLEGVVMLFVLVSITVVYLALCQRSFVPRMPQMATVRDSGPRWASQRRNIPSFDYSAAIRISAEGGPTSSRDNQWRGRDPLRDHRAIVGRDARTPWYIRVRSLIVLLLIVIGMGAALAGVTLLIIASGRFLLEILAG